MVSFNFLLVVIPNILIFFSTLVIFSIARQLPSLASLFRPRSLPSTTLPPGKKPPPNLPTSSTFGWILPLLRISDRDILETAGFDALVLCRFNRLCIKIFFAVSSFCCLMLMPVYATAHGNQAGFESTSIANLGDGTEVDGNRFWACVLVMYIVVAFVIYMIQEEYKYQTRLRHAYLKLRSPHAYTILVQNIHPHLCNDKLISEFFQEIEPDAFHSAIMNRDCQILYECMEERDDVVRSLEIAKTEFRIAQGKINRENSRNHSYTLVADDQHPQPQAEKTSNHHHLSQQPQAQPQPQPQTNNNVIHSQEGRPKHRIGYCGGKVDSITYYENELTGLNLRFKDLRQLQVVEHINKKRPNFLIFYFQLLVAVLPHWLYQPKAKKTTITQGTSAFVSFKSIKVANSTCQSCVTANVSRFQCHMAPEPSDVLWPSLAISLEERNMRSRVVVIIFVFLVTFWTIPVTFLNLLSNIQEASKVKYLEWVNVSDDILRGIIEGILPSVGFVILVSILWIIIYSLHAYEGVEAHSWLEIHATKSYFMFLVVQIYFVSIISSSLLSQLQNIIDHPSQIDKYLGESIPAVAFVFLNFIFSQTFLSQGLVLLQSSSYFNYFVMGRFAVTESQKRNWILPPPFLFSKVYPQHLLIFLIGMTYSTITPVILPFVFLYFIVSDLVCRYQLIYVNVSQYESGGVFYPMLVNRLMASLIISILAVMFVMGVKRSPITAALAPLLFIVFYYWSWDRENVEIVQQYLPLKDCAIVEAHANHKQTKLTQKDFLGGAGGEGDDDGGGDEGGEDGNKKKQKSKEAASKEKDKDDKDIEEANLPKDEGESSTATEDPYAFLIDAYLQPCYKSPIEIDPATVAA